MVGAMLCLLALKQVSFTLDKTLLTTIAEPSFVRRLSKFFFARKKLPKE